MVDAEVTFVRTRTRARPASRASFGATTPSIGCRGPAVIEVDITRACRPGPDQIVAFING
jgi:hypothetical protein